jgi:hypothetical protein
MKYSVDRRVGCIAVINNTIPPPSNGLHSDNCHVIKYWHGYWLPNSVFYSCTQEVGGSWRIANFITRRAEKLCQKLNAEEKNKLVVQPPNDMEEEKTTEKNKPQLFDKRYL